MFVFSSYMLFYKHFGRILIIFIFFFALYIGIDLIKIYDFTVLPENMVTKRVLSGNSLELIFNKDDNDDNSDD